VSGSHIKVTNSIGDVAMAKEKVVLRASLCLVLVLAGLSGWLYVRIWDLENRVNRLESIIDSLYQVLQTDVAKDISIFLGTKQLIVENFMWKAENAGATFTPTFTVRNNGASNIALVAVFVNDTLAKMNASSTLLSPGGQATVTVTKTGGFTSGMKYEFTFITASGNQFVHVATAP